LRRTAGLLSARDGFALNASGDFSLLAQADIVVVPYWGGESAPAVAAA
jgi:hypothetical protein